jgi:hypothetical protein
VIGMVVLFDNGEVETTRRAFNDAPHIQSGASQIRWCVPQDRGPLRWVRNTGREGPPTEGRRADAGERVGTEATSPEKLTARI